MLKKLNRTNAGLHQTRTVKVLQFGDGNFLRGFATWIFDILNEKTNFNGDIHTIHPLRKGSTKSIDEQDGLYHLLLNGLREGKVVSETRLITCVSGTINPYTEFQKFLQAGENPDLQFIISNTTEAGIVFNPSDQSPEEIPDSFPGKATLLMYRRFEFFQGDPDKGVIFMPCELIEQNGDTLKSIMIKYSTLWKLPDTFIEWLDTANIFCNSLVDRIVPGFPSDTIDQIQNTTGYEDRLMVAAEPYHLWVIEAPDKVQELFPTEKAGLSVKYVDDLTPYLVRKVRILNGAHTTLLPVAYLHGLRMVKESVDNKFIGDFIRKAIYNEIIPTLDLPEEELREFADDVLERFQNPFIKHQLISIALNSISKFKVRVLPTILEYKNRIGKLPENLIYSFAALIRLYKGEWRGEIIPLNDSPEVLALFKDAWKSNDVDVLLQKVLSNEAFWGEDLTKVDGLVEGLKEALNKLEKL